MGILDTLMGRDEESRQAQRGAASATPPTSDERAIARYRYMLQTAPPQTIEQAHEEAFAKLTPEQRRLLLHQLAAELPESERSVAAGTLKDDPRSLSRLATRAEFRQPDTLERSFNGMGGRGGMGGMMAGSFLATVAGGVAAAPSPNPSSPARVPVTWLPVTRSPTIRLGMPAGTLPTPVMSTTSTGATSARSESGRRQTPWPIR